MKTRVNERVEELFPTMVQWRRHMHENPELSYQEEQTARFVTEKLKAFGLDIRTNVGGHGITALLKGGKPGPTVALRADMDALPIQDEKKVPYASKIPGVMHACGHDGHTSSLLAAAVLLSELRDELAGNVKFIFQPAEEVTPGGARRMIEDGALDGVDVIYGIHLWTPFPQGKVAGRSGPVMAAADDFEIEIDGKGGHGGLPHVTVDSLVIGAQLTLNLQTIVSRSLNPVHPAVVTVATLQAGRSFNVVADHCLVKGTVRTFHADARSRARQRLEEITAHTCRMFGADYRLNYKMGYPPLVNDSGEIERFRRVAEDVFGSESVFVPDPIMAAEDFAYYVEKVPGCFLFVGAGGAGAEQAHHHPLFDIDEKAMKQSVLLFAGMTLDYFASAR